MSFPNQPASCDTVLGGHGQLNFLLYTPSDRALILQSLPIAMCTVKSHTKACRPLNRAGVRLALDSCPLI